jgi:hypothetical protein
MMLRGKHYLREISVVIIGGIAVAIVRSERDANVVGNHISMQELAWLQIRACHALVAFAFIPVRRRAG